MNYYQARQRTEDERWDYTCMNDRRIWPVGYCRRWKDWDEDLKKTHPAEYERYVAAKAKFHSEGHATKEEAERCHREYELDNFLKAFSCLSDEQHKCEECGAWTQSGLGLRGIPGNYLCAAHATREFFEKLNPFTPGISTMSSW